MALIARATLVLAISILAILTTVPVANAGLTFCNRTPFPLQIAYSYFSRGAWFTEGWWKVEAGECTTLISGDLNSRFYYIHSEAYGPLASWLYKRDIVFYGDDDDLTLCVNPNKAFRYNNDIITCRKEDLRKFSRIDTGDWRDFESSLGDTNYLASTNAEAQTLAKNLTQRMTEEKAKQEIANKIASGKCTDMPDLTTTKQTRDVPLGGFQVPIEYSSKVFFKPVDNLPSQFQLNVRTDIDTAGLEGLISKMSSREALGIPDNTCEDRFSIQSGTSVSGKNLVTKASFGYSVWQCCKKCWPCPTMSQPGRMCDEKTVLGEYNGVASITWEPSVRDNGRGVAITTFQQSSGDVSGFITNFADILDAITFNTQGFDDMISDLAQSINESVSAMIAEAIPPDELFQDDIVPKAFEKRLRIVSAEFLQTGGGRKLRVWTVGRFPKAVSCQVYDTLSRL